MEAAFPSQLRELIPSVQESLAPSDVGPSGLVQRDPIVWGEVRVDGEALRIPYRQYDCPLGMLGPTPWRGSALPGLMGPRGLKGEARLVWMAWFTRSDSGWIRQAAVRELFDSPREWAVPFIVQLLGEYIVEISADIADFVDTAIATDSDWIEYFRRFRSANPGFVTLTRSRACSYWNEYYRQRSSFAAYPASRTLDAFDGLV